MFNIRKFLEGIRVLPKTTLVSDSKGELEVANSDGKLNYHNGTTRSPVVTESHTATLTNKTIDANGTGNAISNLETADLASGVLNTSTSLSGATNSQIPSALAVSTLVTNSSGTVQTNLDNHINDTTDAHAGSAITNTPSGNLAATTVQGALNELQTDVDTRATSAALTAHISNATGAHAGSAISNTPAGSISSTTVQAAINELDGDIQGHITNATGAHAATAISFSPTGSVSATNVQTAIAEVDSEKAAGAASSTDEAIARFDLTTGKILQNSVVTVTDAGIMAGLTSITSSGSATFTGALNTSSNNSNAQTGANVVLTATTGSVMRLTGALDSIGGYATTTSGRRSVIFNATGADVTIINEDTTVTATQRIVTGTGSDIVLKNGASIEMHYNSTSTRHQVIGGTGSTGAEVPDTFVQLVCDELISAWATGDSATFLGGGTIAGTFAKDTTTPLNGTASYKYTQAAGSLDDYMASPVQEVPIRFRGNQVTYFFPYTYNGGNSDIEPILYDVTNGAKLTTSTNLLPATGTNASIYKVNVTIPSTCTQIRVGFHVKILNSGKILAFDDLQVSADTTKFADSGILTDWQSYPPTFTGFGTPTSIEFEWRRVGGNVEVKGKFASGTPTAVEARISLPNNYTSAGTSIIPSLKIAGKGNKEANATTNFSSASILIEPSVAYMVIAAENSTNSGLQKSLGTGVLAAGNNFTLLASFPIAGLSASNPQIITASDSFSSDTASFVYASSATYTLATLTDAPIGTFITYTYAAAGNVRTQTTTAPTQTTSDMNVNGVQIFTRAYNATSTAGNPVCVAVQIGKGLKGFSLSIFKAAAKVNSGSIDLLVASTTNQNGLFFKDYNESTGILVVDAGFTRLTTNTSYEFFFSDATNQTNGYLTINGSKSPALVGVPQVQPRIATITDVKAANTAGGTFTSGAFQTRTLNTLVDTTGIVTSLTANQFVLPAGTYDFTISAPAYVVDSHQSKLRNITDSTDALIGSSEFSDGAAATSSQTISIAMGVVTITSAKTFEVQHRCLTTRTTDGFGAPANFGVSEVYTQVKILKVK